MSDERLEALLKKWMSRAEEERALRQSAESKLDLANQQALAERDKYDAELVRVDELQSRLDAAEKENAFSRKWIRELRERIEDLMRGDPPAESADGIRLIALADVCEAYEKGVVEKLNTSTGESK